MASNDNEESRSGVSDTEEVSSIFYLSALAVWRLLSLGLGNTNVFLQKHMPAKKSCPCKAAGIACNTGCQCGTRKNPCKNKVFSASPFL